MRGLSANRGAHRRIPVELPHKVNKVSDMSQPHIPLNRSQVLEDQENIPKTLLASPPRSQRQVAIAFGPPRGSHLILAVLFSKHEKSTAEIGRRAKGSEKKSNPCHKGYLEVA